MSNYLTVFNRFFHPQEMLILFRNFSIMFISCQFITVFSPLQAYHLQAGKWLPFLLLKMEIDCRTPHITTTVIVEAEDIIFNSPMFEQEVACECPDNFEGSSCQLKSNPCKNANPCEGGAQCIQEGYDFHCNCPQQRIGGKGVIFIKKFMFMKSLWKMRDLVVSVKTLVISFVYVDQAFKELSIRLLLTLVTQIDTKNLSN